MKLQIRKDCIYIFKVTFVGFDLIEQTGINGSLGSVVEEYDSETDGIIV